MKIAFVTDTHFGVRNDNLVFAEYQKKFFENDFWPVVKEQCDAIVHLGDTFDRRKFINFNSLHLAKEMFFNPSTTFDGDVHMIIGNHDTYFKKKNDVNSPDLLLSDYPIKTYQVLPEEVTIGGLKFLMVPWIAKDHQAEAHDIIQSSTADIVCGHPEVNGFEMHAGIVCHDGTDPNVFKKFPEVYSGHFHRKNTKGNITYLGNAYQLTWADYGDERGFHIYDTETRERTFIKNNQEMFVKLIYDEDDVPVTPPNALTDKMVKVFVKNKKNPFIFDTFVQDVEIQNPLDISIIEDFADLEVGEMEIETKDTLSILTQYVDQLEYNRPEDLKLLMSNLYSEATQLRDFV